ncbi:hypothetical protein JXR93_05695 [bacterium]|nr:hypothetical protein [bacterium]
MQEDNIKNSSQKKQKIALLALFFLVAFGSLFFVPKKKEIHPIRLPENTQCELSKQPVNYQFAVQLHKKSGEILFFASIGYFLEYIKKNRFYFDRAFVMDYDKSKDYNSELWINARVAYYVKTTVPTPDGSGIIGFIDKDGLNKYLKYVVPNSKIFTLMDYIREARDSKN